KLSKVTQWHLNIDHVMNVIEAKHKLVPRVTSRDDRQLLKKYQTVLRTIEKDITWIQPVLWEIEHEFENLKKNDKLPAEDQKSCEGKLKKASAMWDAFKKELDNAMDTVKSMRSFCDFQDEVSHI
ncbi:hypothetical protein FHG87_016248, partial [Trinorchestia longiramus]